MESPRDLKVRLTGLWAAGLVVLGVVGFVSFHFASRLSGGGSGTELDVSNELFNSDTLATSEVVSHLLDGGSLSDWILPWAPYYFPEMLVFFPTVALGFSVSIQVLVFMLFQVLVTGLSVIFLFTSIYGRRAAFAGSLVFAQLSALAVVSGQPLSLLLVAKFHFGAFSMALLGLALVMWTPRTRTSRTTRLLLLGVITAASLASDAAFLTYFVLPIVGALLTERLIFRSRSSNTKLGTLIPILAGAGLAGALIFLRSNSGASSSPSVSLTAIYTSSGPWFRGLGNWLLQNPSYVATALILIGLLVVSLLSRNQQSDGPAALSVQVTDPQFDKLRVVTVAGLLAVALTTISSLALRGELIFTSRYLLPQTWLPIVILALWIYAARSRDLIVALSTLTLATVSLLLPRISVDTFASLAIERYPPSIACVDQTLASNQEMRTGIAGYWDARQVQLLSRLDLTLAPYQEGAIRHTDTNMDRNTKNYRPSYDFAIVSNRAGAPHTLDQAGLLQRAGEPVERVTCGPFEVWLYGDENLVLE